ncbi:DUF3558 domain-containing protein [Amycolatopsis vancoresmycina]|uniref:DUF3558 domain-containing protein n=1 Tax=Amycolatopsis vancoresmycina DSM 44592 TaxID=1292037 RepID=R1HZ01_9PSEU|nr:DUF3558 domain-containing protein [Amycolatopsis vancoresmycina]EOD65511.1 hypothetical protein H480_26182 [Amycolatopsis vancoresmycina DSM 44592]
MNRRLIAVPALAFAVLALAGCAGKTRGTANPAPASESSTETTTRSTADTAPHVPAPLNTGSITSDACATLSASARSDLGLGEGRPRTTGNGPSCTFQEAADPGNQIDVTTVTANKNGLQDVYDTKANDAYWGETQAAGYPGVYAAAVDDRKNGKCGLFVAVTDQLAVNVLVQYDNGAGASDPCPVAMKFGEAMIHTLGG